MTAPKIIARPTDDENAVASALCGDTCGWPDCQCSAEWRGRHLIGARAALRALGLGASKADAIADLQTNEPRDEQ